MRWKLKPPKPWPELGDERVVSRFLLFPKRLQNERRWLERVLIFQRFEKRPYVSKFDPGPNFWEDWFNIRWADE